MSHDDISTLNKTSLTALIAAFVLLFIFGAIVFPSTRKANASASKIAEKYNSSMIGSMIDFGSGDSPISTPVMYSAVKEYYAGGVLSGVYDKDNDIWYVPGTEHTVDEFLSKMESDMSGQYWVILGTNTTEVPTMANTGLYYFYMVEKDASILKED